MINMNKLGYLIVLIGYTHLSAQDTGVVQAEANQLDPSHKLIVVGQLGTAHLIDTAGRHLYTWQYPEVTNWVGAEITKEGQLTVNLEDDKTAKLYPDGRWENTKAKKLKRNSKAELVLENGNSLSWEMNGVSETNTAGDTVWKYINQDKDLTGKIIPITSVVAYSQSEVEELMTGISVSPPFTRTEISQLEQVKERDKEITPTSQYKRINRESIALIEAGYMDEAHTYLLDFIEKYPDDLEGLYAITVLQTRRGNLKKAVYYAEQALRKGLPVPRFKASLLDWLKPLLRSEAFVKATAPYESSDNVLVHGPMLGQLTDTSVSVWLRTSESVNVKVKVYSADQQRLIASSEATATDSTTEYTATVLVSNLKPNTAYTYTLLVEDQPTGAFHAFNTMQSKGDPIQFSLGFAGGAGYTPRYERMWDTLCTHNLSHFLLLGDNVYIDHPERPATQQYCYYRRQSRPEYKRFSAETALYAIWDDHDFTYNDERGGPEIDQPYWKRPVWAVFQNQWNNPYYGGGEAHPGCYQHFSIGDVDFFLLDCRYYRENPESQGASMLGEVQKQWLKDRLSESTATFKVIASSVPWAKDTKPGSLDTWDGHPEEREEIFSFMEENRIEGVLLIAADRHRSDAWRIERPEGYDLYEFMSSKLTNVHTHKVMPGSLFGYNKTCSFGRLDFDTTREVPQVTYRVISIDNEEIHRMTIYRDQLIFRD